MGGGSEASGGLGHWGIVFCLFCSVLFCALYHVKLICEGGIPDRQKERTGSSRWTDSRREDGRRGEMEAGSVVNDGCI